MPIETREPIIKLSIICRLAAKGLPYSRRTYLLMLSTFTKITPVTSSSEIPESVAIATLDKIFQNWRTTKILPETLSDDFRKMAEGISNHFVSELGHPEEVMRQQIAEAEKRRAAAKNKPRAKSWRKKTSQSVNVKPQLTEFEKQRAARRQERFNS